MGIRLHAHPYDVLPVPTVKQERIVAHPDENVVSSLAVKLVGTGQLVIQHISYQVHSLGRLQIKIVQDLNILHLVRRLKYKRSTGRQVDGINARIRIL